VPFEVMDRSETVEEEVKLVLARSELCGVAGPARRRKEYSEGGR
jgi:hypothetical protein